MTMTNANVLWEGRGERINKQTDQVKPLIDAWRVSSSDAEMPPGLRDKIGIASLNTKAEIS